MAFVRSDGTVQGRMFVGHSSLIAAVTSELTATAWCERDPLACGASHISMDRRKSGMVVGGEDKCTSARRHRKNYTRQRDRSYSRAPTFNKWCESGDYQLLSASESVLLIKCSKSEARSTAWYRRTLIGGWQSFVDFGIAVRSTAARNNHDAMVRADGSRLRGALTSPTRRRDLPGPQAAPIESTVDRDHLGVAHGVGECPVAPLRWSLLLQPRTWSEGCCRGELLCCLESLWTP